MRARVPHPDGAGGHSRAAPATPRLEAASRAAVRAGGAALDRSPSGRARPALGGVRRGGAILAGRPAVAQTSGPNAWLNGAAAAAVRCRRCGGAPRLDQPTVAMATASSDRVASVISPVTPLGAPSISATSAINVARVINQPLAVARGHASPHTGRGSRPVGRARRGSPRAAEPAMRSSHDVTSRHVRNQGVIARNLVSSGGHVPCETPPWRSMPWAGDQPLSPSGRAAPPSLGAGIRPLEHRKLVETRWTCPR